MIPLDIANARLRVTLAPHNGKPVPGWVAELAKVEMYEIPPGTVDDFRRGLPSTVPEFAPLPKLNRRSRWKFWRSR